MAKNRRQAVPGIDSNDFPKLSVDAFLYREQQRFRKRLKAEIALSARLPSPSDQGNIQFLRHALGVIAEMRVRNIPSICKPLEQVNADNRGV
jgi:hypothetical protein